MSDEIIPTTPRSNPDAITGLTRRGFIYGTAAAAGGAMLLGRIHPALARPAAALTAGPNTITFKQTGPVSGGTGQVSLTMGSASMPGTLLVATVLTTDPATKFEPPASGGWRLAKAVASAPGGRVEIWYYPGTPPSPGNPGGIGGSQPTAATFTSSAGASCQGAMAEFTLAANTMPVLDAPGLEVGTSAPPFSLTAAAGNAAGTLGIAMAADFFGPISPNITGWSGPAQWTALQQNDNSSQTWGSWYDEALSAGFQSLTATYTLGQGSAGSSESWAFAFAAFRAVTFQALHLDGGEMITMVALDASGQQLVMAGDVEGLWRTSDFGDHWQLSQDGLYLKDWRCVASVAWSQLNPRHVYACVGKTGVSQDGGFMMSSDGGVSWALLSNDVQFRSNDAGSVRGSDPQDSNRSVGNLLAQDPNTNHLWVAAYSGGIFRSSSAGNQWNAIGPATPSGLPSMYGRALVVDPDDASQLFAGFWATDANGDPVSSSANGGVWHCVNAANALTDPNPPTWAQLAGFPDGSGGTVNATVSDLTIAGEYLYAASPDLGVFRHQIGTSNGWQNLTGGPMTAPDSKSPIWTSIDGYKDPSTGNHVIVAACGFGPKITSGGVTNPNHTNLVQITIDQSTGAVSYFDLTGQAQITLTPEPPDSQPWWRTGSSWTYWLGGGAFVNPHVLIDPNDQSRIYVTGAGGFFRTYNADAATEAAVNWTIAVTGAPMANTNLITVDPNAANHVLLSGSDFTQTDLTDPTGYDTSQVNGTAGTLPVSGVESHAVAFDSGSNVYTGVNTKYGDNSGGAVFWRAAGDSTFTWFDTGYSHALDPNHPLSSTQANAPVGLFAGSQGAVLNAPPFLLAVAQGAGMYRAVPPQNPQNKWTWTQVDSTIGTNGVVAQHCPIAGGSGFTSNVYCYDRTVGVFQSKDLGTTWKRIWTPPAGSIGVADSRSGWMAVNPAGLGDEIWVSTNDPGGLFVITVTAQGVSSTSPVGVASAFPNGAGGIVFKPSGQPYVVALNGLNGPSGPSDGSASAQLLTLPSGSTQWVDAGGDSVGSYASWPGPVAMAGDLIMIGSEEDFCIYGIPTA